MHLLAPGLLVNLLVPWLFLVPSLLCVSLTFTLTPLHICSPPCLAWSLPLEGAVEKLHDETHSRESREESTVQLNLNSAASSLCQYLHPFLCSLLLWHSQYGHMSGQVSKWELEAQLCNRQAGKAIDQFDNLPIYTPVRCTRQFEFEFKAMQEILTEKKLMTLCQSAHLWDAHQIIWIQSYAKNIKNICKNTWRKYLREKNLWPPAHLWDAQDNLNLKLITVESNIFLRNTELWNIGVKFNCYIALCNAESAF